MATNILKSSPAPTVGEHDFSWAEVYALRRFHPRSIFIGTAGFIWFIYYLWNHDWRTALAVAVITRVIAFASVMSINTDLYGETLLGRIALLHLNPWNLIIQLGGTLAILYGVWEHSTELILGGLSAVFLGHIFGWSKVDPKLADRK
jgi:hypothetical protein